MILNKTHIKFIICIISWYLYMKFGLHDFMYNFSLMTKIIDIAILLCVVLAGLGLYQALIYEFLKNKGKKKD